MTSTTKTRQRDGDILLLVERDRDRQLLERHLGESYDVSAGTPTTDWDGFDLCLVDAPTYERVGSLLSSHKRGAEPTFLPIVLLLHDENTLDRWLHSGGSDRPIDDILVLPTQPEVLDIGVQTLLYAREISLALERERDQFTAIAENISEGLVVSDATGRIIYANASIARIIGRSVGGIEDQSISAILPSGIESVSNGVVETEIEHAEGHDVHVAVTGASFETHGESLTAYVVRDISDRIAYERELETRNRQLELALRASDQTAWAYSPTDEAIVVHGPDESILGLDDQYDVETFRALLHPEDRERYDRATAEVLESGGSYRQEVRYTHADTDEQRWLEIAGEVIHDDDRDPLLLGTARDVTHRKRRERERERLLDLFEKTQSIADVGGWEYDIDTGDLRLTDQLRQMGAVDPGTSVDIENAFAAYHPDDRETVRAAVERAIETEGSFELEARLHRQDGSIRWVDVRGECVMAGDRRLLRGTVHDITERKEDQRALEQTVDFLADAQEIADIGTWEYDVRSDEYTLSSRTREIYGFDRDADLSIEEVLDVYPPAAVERLYESFERAVEGNEHVDIELPTAMDEGDGWVRLHGRVKYDDGEPAVIRGTVQDVTDRVERIRELERSEALIEESTDLNAILDEDGTVRYITPSVERILGYSQAELIGENAFEYVHPDDVEPTMAAFMEAVEQPGARPNIVMRFERVDGTFAHIEATGRNLLDNPHVQGIVAYTRDVTDRIDRERELAKSERRFRAVFEESLDAMLLVDDDGAFVDVNPAAVELFRTDRDELIGISVDDFAPAEFDVDGALTIFREEGNVRGEFPLVRPDGSRRTVEFATTANILPGRSLTILRDITDRVERQRELERYETIVEAAPDPIYVLDNEGRFLLANEAAAAALGQPRDELLGHNITELLPEEDVDAALDHIASLVDADGSQGIMDLSLETSEGRREFEVSIALLAGEESDLAGTAGVARDVTDLRERERRLSVLDRVLRHNLRNKMNVVLGNVDEILRHADDETVRNRAEAIEVAGGDLQSLSESVRQFHDSIDPDEDEVHTADLVAEVDDAVAETRLAHPDATIETHLTFAAPAKLPATLDLALTELIENAIVHNDSDDPTVQLTLETAPDEVVLTVADDGPGISDLERNALLKGEESPLAHATGIGLWLVRWAVENAGGSFDIRPNDPRGTVV